jgi:hypothetical protein
MRTEPRITTLSISPANQAVLHWIGQGGVASREQVRRRFWPDVRPSSAYRHLHRLVQGGYLLTQPWHLARQQTIIYALTQQSARTIGATAPGIYIGWPSQREMAHLILGQEVRLLLDQQLRREGGALVGWRSERSLRGQAHTRHNAADIPDAEATFYRAPGGTVETVEIEIDGQYYGQMLARKAARYGTHSRPILWATRPARAALVGAAIRPYPNITLIVLPKPLDI